MALSSNNLSRKRDAQTDESQCSTAQHIVRSSKELFRTDKKRQAAALGGHKPVDDSTKRPGASPENAIVIEDSEPEHSASKIESQHHDSRLRTYVNEWRVKTGESEKALDPKKILKLFRVVEKTLA